MTHIFGQGVQYGSKLISLLNRLLLIAALHLPLNIYAEPGTPVITHKFSENRIVIIHSADDKLYTTLAQKLSRVYTDSKTGTQSSTTPYTAPDVVIVLGVEGLNKANKYYPNTSKLLIVTDPGVYWPDTNSDKNNAVLYMTQSFCKQVQFIKLINKNWKAISLLNSQNKPVNSSALEQCASRFGMRTYVVKTEGTERLTSAITEALNHSDILLALPDSKIYNSKTVKNILLTSYRLRKPVIGFSANFVTAGALASVHSNQQQITETAVKLIKQYLNNSNRFTQAVSYPDAFEISINKQVFMALDLTMPDTEELKQALKQMTADDTGELQ